METHILLTTKDNYTNYLSFNIMSSILGDLDKSIGMQPGQYFDEQREEL